MITLVQGPEASKEHCLLCFDTLAAELGLSSPGAQGTVLPRFENASCPLFVTWHKAPAAGGGELRLRGCIGTLEPRPLASAVRDYALTSALRDRRFAPVEGSELPLLTVTVSLLCRFEPAAHAADWAVGTHGLLLEFPDPATGARRTATFLPEVAAHQRWSWAQTLEQLVRKAGYGGPASDVLGTGGRFKLTRYESTTASMSYQEWARLRAGAERGKEHDGLLAEGGERVGSPSRQPFRMGGAGRGGKARSRQLVSVPA